MDQLITLANGNPGALEVVAKLVQKYPDTYMTHAATLQVNNIRGADIWIIYKLCNKDIEKFINYKFDTYKRD